MSIRLATEKSLPLTSPERVSIYQTAISMATLEDGSVSSFLFNRALYVCIAIELSDEETQDKYIDIVMDGEGGYLGLWDNLVREGIIEQKQQEYSDLFDVMSEEGEVWFKEKQAYSQSFAPLGHTIEKFFGKDLGEVLEKLQDEDTKEVLDVAKEWGMTRPAKVIPFSKA